MKNRFTRFTRSARAMRSKRISAALALYFASALHTAAATDLMDVWQAALGHDAQFAIALSGVDVGREQALQARAGMLPRAALAAGSQRQSTRLPAPMPKQDYNSHYWAIQLSQPLYRPAARIVAQQGELQQTRAGIELDQARQNLMLRVAERYLATLDAQSSVAAYTQLYEASSEQMQRARAAFEAGSVTITDVHEAQSRRDLAQAQLIAAQTGLDLAHEALSMLTGQTAGTLAALSPASQLTPPQPAAVEHWAQEAEQNNPAVRIAQNALTLAHEEIRRQRAAHQPGVDLVASHRQAKRPENNPALANVRASSIGIEFSLPLYAGGAISSAVRQAQAQLAQAESALEETRRQTRLAARQAFLGILSGLAQIRALHAAETTSESALEANLTGYEVGARINIDVLNAQSQLAETRRLHAHARHQTLLAQLRLKAAAGTLAEDDLQQANALLSAQEKSATPEPQAQEPEKTASQTENAAQAESTAAENTAQ